MKKLKLSPREIHLEVMDYLIEQMQKISFGEVVLVAQDGVLVQIESQEKLRLANWGQHLEQQLWTDKQQKHIVKHLQQEFSHLAYGKLVIVIKNGNVIQMERTEKQRFTGLDGEGI